MSEISPFGWKDDEPPDISSANLEKDRSEIGQYAREQAKAAQEASIPLTQKNAAKGVAGLNAAGELEASQVPPSVVSDSTIGAHLQVIDPCDAVYGAVNDAHEFGGVSMAEGSKIAVCITAPFTAGNVKQPNGEMKWMVVALAGVNKAPLFSRIVKYVSATEVELETAASTTVAEQLGAFGTDSTAAFQAAFAVMETSYTLNQNVPVMWIKPGPGNGFFLREGAKIHRPLIKTYSRQAVTFYLPAKTWVVESPIKEAAPTKLAELDVKFRTFGGGGAILHTYTGVNSGITDFLADVECYYPECGVGSLTSDNPYWKIAGRCTGPGRLGIGVALAGYTDACEIDMDYFGMQIGNKLGRGSDSCFVRGTWTPAGGEYKGVPQIANWIVPNPVETNSGRGTVFVGFRFGNEGYDKRDYKVLIADEIAGGNFSNNQPNLAEASTGSCTGLDFIGCLWVGQGAIPAGPLVYTTTPNVGGCHFAGVIDGTLPNYVLQYMNPPSTIQHTLMLNVIGPFVRAEQIHPGYQSCQATNGNNVAIIIDWDGLFSRFTNTPLAFLGGGRRTGMVTLVGETPHTTAGEATVEKVTDAVGGKDAYLMTFKKLTDSVYMTIPTGTMVVGQTLWLDFDMLPGSMEDIEVTLRYANGKVTYQEAFVPGSTWQPHRDVIPEGVRDNTENWQLVFKPKSGTGTITIGRGRLIAAREPISIDAAATPNIQSFTTSGEWTKPAGATVVTVDLVAQGGGGGSGRQGAAGSVRCGGGGGGGAGMTNARFPAAGLKAKETVTIPNSGGKGGAAQAAENTNGNPGEAGTNAQFGSKICFAAGGGGGAGGTNATGTGGSGGGGGSGPTAGLGGSASVTGGVGAAGGSSGSAGPGGGAGGGIPTGNTFSNGGKGGSNSTPNLVGGAGGEADGAKGSEGVTANAEFCLTGSAGGGGASSVLAAGGEGGKGGSYGAGGGGGGASLNTYSSGAGGNGAPGFGIVVSW
jgi:hypothetical protein